jgi:hypothetical protein
LKFDFVPRPSSAVLDEAVFSGEFPEEVLREPTTRTTRRVTTWKGGRGGAETGGGEGGRGEGEERGRRGGGEGTKM